LFAWAELNRIVHVKTARGRVGLALTVEMW
jgi:hypothetical protein